MIQIPKRWEQWGKTLLAAVISGFSNSILAVIGVGTANTLGDHMPKLTVHQMLAIGGSGAFIGAVMFLKQSPVPPDSTGNTEQFIKPQSPT